MEIDFGYIFRTSTKPIWKGSKIETVEDGLRKYAELLKEGWKEQVYTERICKNKFKITP